MYPTGDRFQGIEGRLTRSHGADAITRCMRAIGVDPAGYSNISARKGAISAAVIEGLPADLRRMQTGQSSSAWTHYFDLAATEELYSFYKVFKF